MTDPTRPATSYALAFETSSADGMIAIGSNRRVIATEALSGPRRHATELLPATASLCLRHGVDPQAITEVMVSIGPGSFTGLRIGVTVARMMAMSTGATIVPVPTLAVIAQNALSVSPKPPHIAVILDAKRGRVYASTFRHEGDRYVEVTAPKETDPAAFLASQPPTCAVLGEGVAYHQAAVESSGLTVLSPDSYPPQATTVLTLGWQLADNGGAVDPRDLVPTYIRLPEAEEKWAQRHGPTGAKP